MAAFQASVDVACGFHAWLKGLGFKARSTRTQGNLLEKDFHKLYMSRPQVTFWSWQFLPNWRLGAGRDL